MDTIRKTILNKEWWILASVRAMKTFAQATVSMLPVGVCITEVQWWMVLGTALLAAICSMFTSIAGIPELKDATETEADIETTD